MDTRVELYVQLPSRARRLNACFANFGCYVAVGHSKCRLQRVGVRVKACVRMGSLVGECFWRRPQGQGHGLLNACMVFELEMTTRVRWFAAAAAAAAAATATEPPESLEPYAETMPLGLDPFAGGPSDAALSQLHPAIADRPDLAWRIAYPGGEPSEPVDAATMQDWLAGSQAEGTELVWRADWADWQPVRTVFPEFFPGA